MKNRHSNSAHLKHFQSWRYQRGRVFINVITIGYYFHAMMYIMGHNIGSPKVSHTIHLPTLFTIINVVYASLNYSSLLKSNEFNLIFVCQLYNILSFH